MCPQYSTVKEQFLKKDLHLELNENARNLYNLQRCKA